MLNGPETYDLRLEDLSASIDLIRDMLEQYAYDNAGETPACVHAAVALLRQTQRHFTDLDYFISEKLGELKITVPWSGPFYFDRIDSRQLKFLDVRILSKEERQAEIAAAVQQEREREEAQLYPGETEEMKQARKKKEKEAEEANNLEFAFKIGQTLSAEKRAVLIKKLAEAA